MLAAIPGRDRPAAAQRVTAGQGGCPGADRRNSGRECCRCPGVKLAEGIGDNRNYLSVTAAQALNKEVSREMSENTWCLDVSRFIT